MGRRAIGRPAGLRSPATAGAAALGIFTGVATATGHGAVVLGLVLLTAAFAVGLVNWRWSVYGLLLYLPFSGIPSLLLYPHKGPGVLAKDFLFVLPAYAGFFGAYVAQRKRIVFDGAPIPMLALVAAIVILQTFNPSIPSMLVGLIGLKVWLFYVPLLFLGYHFVRSREDLDRMLWLMCLAAIVPAAIGIIEAILIYGGKSAFVYSLYGDAAAEATQGFAGIAVGGSVLRRVPSTFTFVFQYAMFATAMVAIAHAAWRGSPRRRGLLRPAVYGLMILAAFLSGSRFVFVTVPLMVMFISALEGRSWLRSAGVLAGAVTALLLASSVIGTGFVELFGHLASHTVQQFDLIVVKGVREALNVTWIGLGSGTDTIASRYATDRSQLFANIGGWQESWWVKAWLELGIIGLVAVTILLGGILRRAFAGHRRLRDPKLRTISAAIIAMLCVALFSGIKQQYMDLDPLNVYFWLFTGVLMKIFVLDRGGAPAKPPTASDHALSGSERAPARPQMPAGTAAR